MKYKTIPLSEVKEGDEVFSILRGWGEVRDIVHDIQDRDLLIRWPNRSIQTYYTRKGYAFKNDLNPELTEARRPVKTVTKEGWVIKDVDNKTVYHFEIQDTPENAISYASREYFGARFIPCRITWEEEE